MNLMITNREVESQRDTRENKDKPQVNLPQDRKPQNCIKNDNNSNLSFKNIFSWWFH